MVIAKFVFFPIPACERMCPSSTITSDVGSLIVRWVLLTKRVSALLQNLRTLYTCLHAYKCIRVYMHISVHVFTCI